MFKKHKFKFLALLLILVVGGGVAYYFKKKEVDKKAAKMDAQQETEQAPKEPLAVDPISDKPTKKPTTSEKATTKELVVSKGDKQLLAKSK